MTTRTALLTFKKGEGVVAVLSYESAEGCLWGEFDIQGLRTLRFHICSVLLMFLRGLRAVLLNTDCTERNRSGHQLCLSLLYGASPAESM